jgi:hypothetical protein
MKPFRLNIEWSNGTLDSFVNVKEYSAKEGALLIWFCTDKHQGAHVIPHHAYKMAWPEFMED